MTAWRDMTEEQKEHDRNRRREYNKSHPEWYANRKKYDRSRYNRDAYRMRKRSLERHHKLRRMTIEYYSNNTMKCACCGESEYKFLTIDHINGGGIKHLKQFKSRSAYIAWFVKNNFPPGFQVLCYNCNCSKGYYGICPHQEMKQLNKEVKEELK